MATVKTIFNNMSWMAFSQVLGSVLAFIWTLFTARYLGVYEYGVLGTAMSFAGLFVVVCDLGTMYYAVREISTDFSIEQKFMDNCFSLRIVLGFIYFVLTLSALILTGWDSHVITICFIFAIHGFLGSVLGFLVIPFQAHVQMKYQAIMYIISNVITFVCILLVLFADFGIFGISMAYVIGYLFSLIYVLYILKAKFVFPKFGFDFNLQKTLVIGGIPFALNNLFNTVYYSIDIVMLTYLSSNYFTGLYSASYKLIDTCSIFYRVFTATIFPIMSQFYKNDESLLKVSFSKSIKYLSFVTIPLSVAMLFYGSDIIVLCYGSKFSDAGSVLSILVWSVCFLFINGVAVTTLNASHKERSVTIMYLLTSLFNVVVNLILIPKYTVYGAALATILSDILLLILALYVLGKINLLPEKKLLFDLLKITFASLIMGIILYEFKLNIFIACIVGTIVYLIIIILVRFFDETDKLIIKQVLNR